jgi:hypothetical protein
MEERTIKYRGHDIRVAPDGKVNVTDVSRALGLSRNQWYMEYMKNSDRYDPHLGKHRFVPRGPASTTMDLEGMVRYLEHTETNTPEAAKVRRALTAFYRENATPDEFIESECEEVLAAARNFLDKLKSVPVELAEEFVLVRNKIQAVL